MGRVRSKKKEYSSRTIDIDILFCDDVLIETKKLTDGSRNILDLSMKSLVERGDPNGTPFFDLGDPMFMRGGVEFSV